MEVTVKGVVECGVRLMVNDRLAGRGRLTWGVLVDVILSSFLFSLSSCELGLFSLFSPPCVY
jgi:hypothetical protein